MNAISEGAGVSVPLQQSTFRELQALRRYDHEPIDAVLRRLIGNSQRVSRPHDRPRISTNLLAASGQPASRRHKYAIHLLGEQYCADTLGQVFAELIDALADIDAGAVEKLARQKSRKRAFVARHADAIHPGRPDLPVQKTRSGWWVSSNVGIRDTIRALRALCEANGLVYGSDVQLEGARAS